MENQDYQYIKSEAYEKWEQERDLAYFRKMYPDIDYDNKYILWLQLNLWWPYSFETIRCTLSVSNIMHVAPSDRIESNQGLLQSETQMVSRHLFPNHCYSTACMKNGCKRCDAGVVLYFDTFEELEQVTSIVLTWHIRKTTTSGEDCYIQTLYNLSFEKDPEKKVYTLFDISRTLLDFQKDKGPARYEKWADRYMSIYYYSEGKGDGLLKGAATAESLFHWISLMEDGTVKHAEQFTCNMTLKPERTAQLSIATMKTSEMKKRQILCSQIKNNPIAIRNIKNGQNANGS